MQPLMIMCVLLWFMWADGASRAGRLSLVDWASYSSQEAEGPGTYAFGYDIEDPETENVQFRNEERHYNGTVTGSYGYLAADGSVIIVHYTADTAGYRSKVEKISIDKQNVIVQEFGNEQAGQPKLSSEAISALLALKSFKKQQLHERRTRPIDQKNSLVEFNLI